MSLFLKYVLEPEILDSKIQWFFRRWTDSVALIQQSRQSPVFTPYKNQIPFYPNDPKPYQSPCYQSKIMKLTLIGLICWRQTSMGVRYTSIIYISIDNYGLVLSLCIHTHENLLGPNLNQLKFIVDGVKFTWWCAHFELSQIFQSPMQHGQRLKLYFKVYLHCATGQIPHGEPPWPKPHLKLDWCKRPPFT